MNRQFNIPEISTLKERMQSLAVLDAILCPQWDLRYYSFNASWAKNEMMGSIRNGCGDEVFVLFTNAGCFIKVFAHEQNNVGIRPTDLYAMVPLEFVEATREPAFSPEYATTCHWRLVDAGSWETCEKYPSSDPKANGLLESMDGNLTTFLNYALEYYEVKLPPEPVAAIIDRHPITPTIAKELGRADINSDLIDEIMEIGYPISLKP